MMSAAQNDPVLNQLRQMLDRAYGNRIDKIVLFGSRARGDAKPDSDYDVAVFLKHMDGLRQKTGKLAEIGEDIFVKTGAIINALPLNAKDYERSNRFMGEIRKDGREL